MGVYRDQQGMAQTVREVQEIKARYAELVDSNAGPLVLTSPDSSVGHDLLVFDARTGQELWDRAGVELAPRLATGDDLFVVAGTRLEAIDLAELKVTGSTARVRVTPRPIQIPPKARPAMLRTGAARSRRGATTREKTHPRVTNTPQAQGTTA